jgi:serine/threonine-protein kinase
MATFETASTAVQAALQFQHALMTGFGADGDSGKLRARIGLHLGEVTDVGTDIHGQPKIIGLAADLAARVAALALPGQILLTRSAFDDSRQYVREHPPIGEAKADEALTLRWMAHGPYVLKGRDEPLEVFEVGAEGIAPLHAPGDSEKARRAVRVDEEETLGWRPAAGLEIPRRKGWTLERQLGLGGFGEVWLGINEKMRERRVFKFCFDADRLRSFRREITLFRLLRETLGDRPDIAQLHEVQLEQPPYYLESEYSELGNLEEWCATQGGLANVPLADRIDIVARVADAVAAAHSVGVLHKDIKPSNILMYRDADGLVKPRIADFGIGVLSDRT